ncbi:hypothetical protein B1C78_15370 [Thioalkalivibrio denitrificans]|uniref:RNA-binding protein n=2 Tax=Thioalkalivibrio denitrificans TaxID=108003 RepID=A0A1V3NB97_9GAMM|nr:hypothetical protein B1C78_15370 [Thioalkalivibrio denitrificans]
MRRVRQLIDDKLLARARLMGGLTESLRSLLPPALAPRCRVAAIAADQLTLSAEGGAWATQLRYLQREIIKHMNAHHGLDIRRVKVHVSAPAGPDPAASAGKRPVRRPRVPDAAVDTLRRTARTVNDPGLAGALERLATKSGKRRS